MTEVILMASEILPNAAIGQMLMMVSAASVLESILCNMKEKHRNLNERKAALREWRERCANSMSLQLIVLFGGQRQPASSSSLSVCRFVASSIPWRSTCRFRI